MDKKDIIDFFNMMAPDWDKEQIRNEEVIKIILDKGAICEGASILDVACGTGVLFPDYISRGATVTGVDLSPEMVKIAKEKFPQAEVICADAQTHCFSKKFDAVMIYNAFPHFSHPERLMENLAGALKDGGRLTVAHGMSAAEIEACHEGKAKSISLPLPTKEELAKIMTAHFDVDVMISDEHMYMVSGIKTIDL